MNPDFAIATAREAGRAIMEIYNRGFTVETKADSSPVTAADLAAHRVIVRRLKEEYPDVPVLSEESADRASWSARARWRRYWLVDPLDGTKEFIKRNGWFTVNIAYMQDNRPHSGVVYAPAADMLYYGSCGGGAFKVEGGGEPVALRRPPFPESGVLRVVGSLSHPSPEMEDFIREKRKQYDDVQFLAMGSSLKICLVAEGKADIYPRFGPTMEWDTAAAHAVLRAAGGRLQACGSDAELPYNKENLRNGWFVAR